MRAVALRLASRGSHLVAVALVALASTVCVALDLLKTRESEKRKATFAFLAGTVSSERPDAPWLVVFVAEVPCDDDRQAMVEAARSGAVSADARRWRPEIVALRDRLLAKAALARS